MTEQRSTLPARRARLIGRDDALAAVRDLVLHGDARLVTLSGPAGAGKTTLALEVARRLNADMPDGVAFVSLTDVREPDAIALACCRALGILDQGRSAADALAAYLAPRQMLVVIDNCEHLQPVVAELVDGLLDACQDLRLLSTSRVRLHVRGETVFSVPPLSVPDPQADADPQSLGRIPSVELFVRRATDLNGGFALADCASAVATICRQLDGLPLAIELAAAQTAALTPLEIAARLGADGGEHTMDETLDWSHDLLAEREQAVLRRCAVFAGGWTLEAAEAVCALDDDPATVASTLVSLVEHSLVLRDPESSGGRFRMLAPIAEYASRRLAASDELMPASLAHAQYYLGVISGGSVDWRTADPDRLDVIEIEYENALAAMQFAERAGVVPLVMGFNVSLLLFWRVRGRLRSGVRRLEAALALIGEEHSRERGLVLVGLTHYRQLLGELEMASRHAIEAEGILVAVGDVIGQRTVIGFLGDIALDRNDFEGARAQYARARAMVETDADGLDVGFYHANVGRVADRAGDVGEAERELELALGFLRSTPAWYQGHVLVQLGSLARRRGDVPTARSRLVEALGHLHRYRATIETISCLDELGRLALDERDHPRAATLFAAATGLRDAAGLTLSADGRASLADDYDATRSALSPEAFDEAWVLGIGFTLDDAAAFASSPTESESWRLRRRGSALTAREREIAQLVARGMTNRQIAEQLVIAHGTVRIHVERILGKLGLTSRVQIATWVTRQS